MPTSNQAQSRAYDFLRQNEGKVITAKELAEYSGWTLATVRKYASKSLRPYFIPLGSRPARYRVEGFVNLSIEDFLRILSQSGKDYKLDPSLKYCCADCFTSNGIQNFINEYDINGDCNYCGRRNRKVASVKEVGKFILERMPYFQESSLNETEKLELVQYKASPLHQVLIKPEVFHIHSDNKQDLLALINDLIPPYGHYLDPEGKVISKYFPKGLHEPVVHLVYNPNTFNINLKIQSRCRLFESWNYFKGHIKEVGRFFDFDPKTGREARLRNFDSLFEKSVINFKKGDTIYRARIIDKNFFRKFDEAKDKEKFILQEIGPPPQHKYKINRMNPPGIQYFYGTQDKETAIAEVNPEISDIILVAKFSTKNDLQILNLLTPYKLENEELSKLYSKIATSDIFDPLFYGFAFLNNFTYEISQPIKDETKEINYVSTQVISEYIRFKGYQGFQFASSKYLASNLPEDRYNGGKNITLFCGPYEEATFGKNLFNQEYDGALPFDKRIHSYHFWLELKEYEFVQIDSVKYKSSSSHWAKFYLENPQLLK